jgi:hypothetical protein
MTVIFIGGPLDGELREVEAEMGVVRGSVADSGMGDGEFWATLECPHCCAQWHIGDVCACGYCWGYSNGEAIGTPQDDRGCPDYHIANGIARHESVSDDEVARRVHDYQTAAMHWMRGESNDKLTMQLHHPLAWHS